MIYKNKKGDFVMSSLVIIVLLVLFFLLVDPLQAVTNEVSAFSGDSTQLWMLRAFPFLILIGIARWVLISGRTEA